jgi:hypothetical protein
MEFPINLEHIKPPPPFHPESSNVIAAAASSGGGELTTALGRKRFSKVSKFSLLHSFASGCIMIATEAVVADLYTCNTSNSKEKNMANLNRNIIIYLILFIMAQIFQFFLLLDLLWHQNLIQVLAHASFCMGTFIYAIFQYYQLNSALTSNNLGKIFDDVIDTPILVIIIVLAISELAYCYLTFLLYKEFGREITSIVININ